MKRRTKRVGIIGCGSISHTYLKVCSESSLVDIAACADLIQARAAEKAAAFGVPKVCTVQEILADPEIDIILNLTVPAAHAEIGLAALAAGKSLYSEKPLAIERDDAQRMLALAAEHGLTVGCAPDTFLGSGLQTCRRAVDDGLIGEPIAATAFMMGRGPEDWHPDPGFFYRPGGGPLLDMGPYYLTALVSILGPIRRVAGAVKISAAERLITSRPKAGQRIKVETPTHITGLLEFASGVVGTMITSFDIQASDLPRMEIYGSKGTLSLPDPNTFGGPVRVRAAGDPDWRELPLPNHGTNDRRGIGLLEMAAAMEKGRRPRADGRMAFHVLEAMGAMFASAHAGAYVVLASRCERPAPLAEGEDLPAAIR